MCTLVVRLTELCILTCHSGLWMVCSNDEMSWGKNRHTHRYFQPCSASLQQQSRKDDMLHLQKEIQKTPWLFFYSIWLFSFEDVGRTSRCVRCPAVQSEQAGASSIKHWSWGKQMWMSSTGLRLSALTSAAINKPCTPSSGCFVVLVCLTLILSAKVVIFGSICVRVCL